MVNTTFIATIASLALISAPNIFLDLLGFRNFIVSKFLPSLTRPAQIITPIFDFSYITDAHFMLYRNTIKQTNDRT